MFSLLFTAVFVISLIFPSPSQALSPVNLNLITKVAHSPVVEITGKKQHLPRNCDKPCSFLVNNGTIGGDCFTLLLTTPTCLQCLVLPRHRNDTLLATALTALDTCQNGTTTFPAITINRAEAPKIVEGFFGNTTTGFNSTEGHRNRNKTRTVQEAVIWSPCPTSLFFPDTVGETSDGGRTAASMVLLVVFAGVVGFASGLV